MQFHLEHAHRNWAAMSKAMNANEGGHKTIEIMTIQDLLAMVKKSCSFLISNLIRLAHWVESKHMYWQANTINLGAACTRIH